VDISPNDAQDALAVIQSTMKKAKHSLATSGVYISLIVTGAIWLVGFLANQFLSGEVVKYVWIGASLLGSALAVIFSSQVSGRVRSPLTGTYLKRIGMFWVLLILVGIGLIMIVQPLDGKQVTLAVILLMLVGEAAMGLLFSFTAIWWALAIGVVAVLGYFLVPTFFYLWMAILVGGGLIGLGVYIHLKW
jgi:hypothetical protein